MVYFKEELIKAIEDSGHSTDDVLFVSAVKYSLDENERYVEELVEIDPEYIFNEIKDFYYDCGFGYPQVNPTMKVMFNDGSWLERGEYDGSEWWEFKATPVRPDAVCNDTDVFFKRYLADCLW